MKRNIFAYSVFFTILTTFSNTSPQASSRAAASSSHHAEGANPVRLWEKKEWEKLRVLLNVEMDSLQPGPQTALISQLSRTISGIIRNIKLDIVIPMTLVNKTLGSTSSGPTPSISKQLNALLNLPDLSPNLSSPLEEAREQLILLEKKRIEPYKEFYRKMQTIKDSYDLRTIKSEDRATLAELGKEHEFLNCLKEVKPDCFKYLLSHLVISHFSKEEYGEVTCAIAQHMNILNSYKVYNLERKEFRRSLFERLQDIILHNEEFKTFLQSPDCPEIAFYNGVLLEALLVRPETLDEYNIVIPIVQNRLESLHRLPTETLTESELIEKRYICEELKTFKYENFSHYVFFNMSVLPGGAQLWRDMNDLGFNALFPPKQ